MLSLFLAGMPACSEQNACRGAKLAKLETWTLEIVKGTFAGWKASMASVAVAYGRQPHRDQAATA